MFCIGKIAPVSIAKRRESGYRMAEVFFREHV